ncbi:MAG: ribulose-phosphate 3-epimerase [Oligoflexia bacterium]|nr:MAG: ribulose-phosphate 3-epimerase [Oligoflexia bacterium]
MSKLIAPSILSADFANLEKEIQAVTAAGADWLHVDVMDGHFVNNITIGVPVVASLKKVSQIPLDVHLMIEKPEKYIRQFVQAGSDYLTIHVESTENPAEVLKEIRRLGAKPGITLRPRTGVEKILPLLPLVDLVLIMTVEPGFGGQEFMTDQVVKIEKIRAEINNQKLNCLIEVDGGVSDKTLHHLSQVDVLVAGSYVFKQDYAQAIKKLKG